MTDLLRDRRRAAAWLGLLILSATLHLVALGDRSYHHDEAIHARLSWDLVQTGAYRYDPTYHGPLLYYLTAATYLVVGDSDFTARLPTAAAGIGMVVICFALRRRLGERAAWWTGLLVTISPLFLFYGRFLRMDVLEAVTASAAILAWLGVVRDRQRAWVWLGVWTGLAFATKENAYVTVTLLAATAGVLAMDRGLRDTVPMATRWLLERWAGVVTSLAVFILVTVPLYTVGFRFLGDWAFPLTAIDYWWGQHTVQRVAGPWWFHLPRLFQYEAVPILAATAWIVRRWRRLGTLELALYIFGVLSVLMYMYLGEKVPWLGVHQVWPFLPLAGLQMARTFGPRGRWWSRTLAGAGLVYTVAVAVISNFVLEEISTAHRRVESLHFVQTCPEIRDVALEVREMAAAGAEGPVASVAGEGAWPMSWYWRDLDVRWREPAVGERPAIVVVNPSRERFVSERLGPGYRREQLPLRAWWLMYAGDPGWRQVARYFLTRVPWSDLGATEVLVLRRSDDAPASVRSVPVPPAAASALTVVQARVLGEGWLDEARGVAAGPGGIAVADSAGAQVVVLDRDGRPTQAGVGGLNQPEQAVWTPSGELLVADTWNHRVVVAGTDGEPRTLPEPDEEGWYGPRSVAVAPDGRVLVADTGHHRIVVFDSLTAAPSRVISSGSGWGELLEPVGVRWLDDGTFLVCDTGHRRVLRLRTDGTGVSITDLPDAWPDYYARPQITVLDRDRWLVTDTPGRCLWLLEDGEVHRLNLFADPSGGDVADGSAPTGVWWDESTRTLLVGDLAGRVWMLEVAGD